jgi:hypothetical protein
MAQDGDTITYTYNGNFDGNNNLIPQEEDISSIDEITVDYLDAAGGESADFGGGSGGRVENSVFDVSGFDTLYIWVSNSPHGRYDSTAGGANGGGSTEISISNTGPADSADEPFLAAAGGGGGSEVQFINAPGGPGARGGTTGSSTSEGTVPPFGGAGGGTSGGDGGASVDDQNRGYTIDSGTTTTGGGSGEDTNGEVKISYTTLNAPPSFTSGSESPTDGATGVSLDPTLSIEVTDADGDSMAVTFRDASDDSKIGSTQTGVADGGTASVTWSGRESDTTYSWYVEADDGNATTTSATFSFTTFAFTIGGVTASGFTIGSDEVTEVTIDGKQV